VQSDISLGELAVQFGLELHGDPALRIDRVANLARAEAGALSFLADSRHRRELSVTRATAVLLSAADADACPVAALVAPNPRFIFAQVIAQLNPERPVEPGVHPTAVVAPDARIPATATVGALAVVESGAVIGERAVIGPHCLVQSGVTIGDDTRLMARVTLYPRVRIGGRCTLHAGVVVGADGFGFTQEAGAWVKVPQIGGVLIGNDVEIGANTTVDCGAIDDTVIEDGVKLDNQIQIGHNCVIGAHTAIAGCTGISGSSIIGKRCMIGGGVGIAGQLNIADDVIITGYTLVTHSIKNSGSYSSGMPAVSTREWRRMVARLRRLENKEK
jgi:UDP-3-O-[3-hydroxymyristoyl] glucosamine N-acyltransferase